MSATRPRRRPRFEWVDLNPIGVGAELRTAREMLGLSIEDAASDTRIRPSYVVALEEEDLSRLPTGVPGRGLFRAYATYLGLDAVELLSALDAHGRLPFESDESDLAPRRAATVHSLAPRLAGLVVALACVFGLTYYLYSEYSTFKTAEAAGTQHAVVTTRGGSPSFSPTPTAIPPTPTAIRQPGIREASFASSASLVPAAAAPSPTAPRPSPAATHAPMTPVPSPTPVPPPPTPVEIVVEASISADTHAKVLVDGQVLSDDVISAGDQRTWRGSTIAVHVDDAGAVEIVLNGRPTGKLGTSGEARTITWTR